MDNNVYCFVVTISDMLPEIRVFNSKEKAIEAFYAEVGKFVHNEIQIGGSSFNTSSFEADKTNDMPSFYVKYPSGAEVEFYIKQHIVEV